jgi:chromosome segregation ATPase
MAEIEVPDQLLLELFQGEIFTRLTSLEEKMTELSGQIQAQRVAIDDLTARIGNLDAGPLLEQVNQLTAANAALVQAQADLQAAFDADEAVDAQTEGDLRNAVADAVAQVDTLTTQVQSAAEDIASGVQGVQENTQRLSALAQPPA